MGAWLGSGYVSATSMCVHPLLMCGHVLACYLISALCLSWDYMVVSGSLLYLAGAGGMLVLFLFAVALCPSATLKLSASPKEDQVCSLVFVLISFLMGSTDVKAWDTSWECSNTILVGDGYLSLLLFMGCFLLTIVVSVVNMCRSSYGCVSGLKVLGATQKSFSADLGGCYMKMNKKWIGIVKV